MGDQGKTPRSTAKLREGRTNISTEDSAHARCDYQQRVHFLDETSESERTYTITSCLQLDPGIS